MAFVTAVAAFGQKLRGDALLGSYRYADSGRLATPAAEDYWRRQFVKLTELANRSGGQGEVN